MNKFVAAAAVGLAALALPCPPASAAPSPPQAAETPVSPPPSDDGASGGAQTPGVRLASSATPEAVSTTTRVAASGLAVVLWLAAIAGNIARRSGWTGRWRRARGRSMSDEELRELLGIGPSARPAT